MPRDPFPPSTNADLIVLGGGSRRCTFGAEHRRGFRKPCRAGRAGGARLAGRGSIQALVPSKTLRGTALALSGWRARRLLGVDLASPGGDRGRHPRGPGSGRDQRQRARARRCTPGGTGRRADPRHREAVDPLILVRVRTRGRFRPVLRAPTMLVATGSPPYRPPEFPSQRFTRPRLRPVASPRGAAQTAGRRRLGVIGKRVRAHVRRTRVDVHLVDGRGSLLPLLDGEISRALAGGDDAWRPRRSTWNEQVTGCDVSRPGDIRLTLSQRGHPRSAATCWSAQGRSSNTAAI